VPSFQAFAEATRCVLVVTQPDRPAGRGLKLRQAPVKAAAHALGIPAIQPERIRDALAALGDTGAELFAIASYGKIVPQAVLDIPRYGALNVHPSLLPLYRGATPLQSQLRDGVTESGVTVILIEHIMRAVMNFSQRLVVLVSGRKIADGRPDEVIRDAEVERAYLGQ